MNFLNLLAEEKPIIPGENVHDFGGAGLTAFVSIIIVFAVLVVIILITHFLFLGINKAQEAIDKSDSKFARFLKRNKPKTNKQINAPVLEKVEIADDDMMAAVLAATIDYQNEVQTDVKLVSVKEIK